MSAETPNPAGEAPADPPAVAAPADPGAADPKRRASTVTLAGIAVVVSVAWYISFVFGLGMPTGLRVGLVVVGGVAAPSLAVFAAVRLAAPALGLSRAQARALFALATLAFAAVALVGVSFSVGMDDGDAGRPKSLLGSLTGPFALVAILATAAAVALPMFAVLRKRRLGAPAATAIAVGVGLVATPLLLVSLLSPASIVGLCVVVFVFALVRSIARAPRPAGPASAVAVRAPDLSAVRSRVTLFAGIALATSLVVWTTGLGVSIRGTGTDVAGSALGISAALAQLAVVPLLWAATLTVAARLPRSADAARIGFAAASVVVVVSVVGMVIGFSPAGDVYIATAGVLSVGVALWPGAVVWSVTAAWPAGARSGAAVVTVVAAAAAYAVLVALSGGVTLALLSGFVAFGGSRLLLRSNRATLPAS